MHLSSHISTTQLLQLMAKSDVVIRRHLSHPQGDLKQDVFSLAREDASGRSSSAGLLARQIEVPVEFVADLEKAHFIRAGQPANGQVIYSLTDDGRRAALAQ
ncbi:MULTISPECIES: hypothetical protein [unclassified Beijerinckia]|uniref:hypothetical protein n=1 Tax=unclassified Beijerinckia TaxID=2638183 RepID=UPI000898FAAC|nr:MULTISPECIES: hypothetical protein [unclassified Beijerinckia]MDH7795996.1 hypothetical protein [Beijerinckia sp. GAS462]SEC25585.1 hypothetical protein SAMN05443249_2274 [Beijerinckia sp. 28-YEA-48]